MSVEKITEMQRKYLSEYGLEDIDTSGLLIRKYKKGQFLCEQGFPLDELLIVISGRIKVFSTASNGKTLLHCFNERGMIIGAVELMTNALASSSVCAAEDAQCISIPHERYRTYLTSNMKFMNRICIVMAEIVVQNSINNSSNILYPFESRLCAYILMTSQDGKFCEKLTELSEYLGTSYRHLLRTLENLCTKGILEKASDGYLIKDDLELRTIGVQYYSSGKNKTLSASGDNDLHS